MPHPSRRRRVLAARRPWTPAELRLAFWWEDVGRQLLYQDIARTTPAAAESDAIGSVTDLTGQCQFAALADDTTRPSLNLAGPNGYRVINSDGINDILTGPSITARDGVTYWGVFRADVAVVGCPFLSGSQAATWRLFADSTTGFARFNSSTGVNSQGPLLTIGQWFIVIGRYRVSDALQSVIVDGAKYDEKATGTGTPVTSEPRFLCRVTSSDSSAAAAGIAARYLTDGECNRLGVYLKNKFNPASAASGPQWTGLT